MRIFVWAAGTPNRPHTPTFRPVLDFLRRYFGILLGFGLLYVAGNLFEPLSYLLLLGIMAFWALQGKERHLLLMLLLILILGDSREWTLFFVKNLRIVAILFLGGWTVLGMARRQYRFNPMILGALPFFAVATLGGLLSPEPASSLSKMVSYFLLLFVALHYLPYLFRRYRQALAQDLLIFWCCVLGAGFLGIVLAPKLVFLLSRFRGLLGNPNGLGILATMLVPLAMLIRHRYPSLRFWPLATAGLAGLSILFCGSRTALGTVGIFLLLHYFYRGGRGRTALLWSIVLPVLLIFFLTVDLQQLVLRVGLEQYLRVESLTTGTGRFLAWEIGMRHIAENLWIGRGFAYEEILFKSLADFFISTEHQGGMHNSYLTFIMNNGLIGFACILVFFAVYLSRSQVRSFAAPAIISLAISALFESWLTSSLNAFTVHFLMITTLLTHFREAAPKRRKPDPPPAAPDAA
ncbi:MAG: O-antigen ligase family protein [Bacteroidia bacterium]|nr:O-antigen ligase family protein [Bacteroidia bacterium]